MFLVDQATGIFIFGIMIAILIYVVFISLPRKLEQEEENNEKIS